MQIQSTKRFTASVETAVDESTLQEPAVTFVTPSGYRDLGIGGKAYSDEALRPVFGPLVNIVSEVAKIALPGKAGMISGAALLVDASLQVADMANRGPLAESLDVEDAFDLFKSLAKGGSELTGDLPTHWSGQSIKTLADTFSVIAKVKGEMELQEVKLDEEILRQLKTTDVPGIGLISAVHRLGKVNFGGLEADPQRYASSNIASVKDLSRTFQSASWAPSAQAILDGHGSG